MENVSVYLNNVCSWNGNLGGTKQHPYSHAGNLKLVSKTGSVMIGILEMTSSFAEQRCQGEGATPQQRQQVAILDGP